MLYIVGQRADGTAGAYAKEQKVAGAGLAGDVICTTVTVFSYKSLFPFVLCSFHASIHSTRKADQRTGVEEEIEKGHTA